MPYSICKYTKDFVAKSDVTRINKMKRKMSIVGKTDRKKKRAIKKGYLDKNATAEGNMYNGTGEF